MNISRKELEKLHRHFVDVICAGGLVEGASPAKLAAYDGMQMIENLVARFEKELTDEE